MLQAAYNNVIVFVETKMIQNLTNAIRMSNLNKGSQINPADYVNVIGTIHSLPQEITDKKRDYKGFSTRDMKVGDTVIMRYDVIWDFEELEDGNAKFKNNVYYNGIDYWIADIQKIFAIIRNGKIRMVNGYCMIEGMTKPMLIVLPNQSAKRLVNASSASLTHISNNLTHLKRIDAEVGDIVYYNPAIVQEYKIKGKEFGILRQSDILGRSTANYAEVAPVTG